MTYGLAVCYPCLTVVDRNRLQVMQNTCFRNEKVAHRRSFPLQNHYFQLEEAVNSIIAEEDDNAYVFPGAITVEEEGPEDDLVTQALPRDVPGTVEVVRRRRLSSDGDTSDDEPRLTYASTSKRPRMSEAAIVASGNPIWRKILPIYSTPHEVNNAIEERLNNLYNDIKDCCPVILFEKLFDQQMCNLIVEQSLLYAAQNNRHG
ncbi:hypothetical protein HHI36_012948 [Cryptolaemus montrouzieri]|uniref:PiggyBac transposable element-derived protein domain-containing protein n=1 Tax=Cryptolaemus montrouzieri TaxID=559131 RepID=A0ABD2NFZ0_9CUCU